MACENRSLIGQKNRCRFISKNKLYFRTGLSDIAFEPMSQNRQTGMYQGI